MATIFVLDGKPQNKQRLPYIPREGEVVEILAVDGENRYIVELIHHRIDLKSPIGVVDTLVHLKTVKGKSKKKGG